MEARIHFRKKYIIIFSCLGILLLIACIASIFFINNALKDKNNGIKPTPTVVRIDTPTPTVIPTLVAKNYVESDECIDGVKPVTDFQEGTEEFSFRYVNCFLGTDAQVIKISGEKLPDTKTNLGPFNIDAEGGDFSAIKVIANDSSFILDFVVPFSLSGYPITNDNTVVAGAGISGLKRIRAKIIEGGEISAIDYYYYHTAEAGSCEFTEFPDEDECILPFIDLGGDNSLVVRCVVSKPEGLQACDQIARSLALTE